MTEPAHPAHPGRPTGPAAAVPAYERLAFPLNVYAWLLWRQEGRAEYLHYGLFDGAHSSPLQAQRHSTELVLDRLPPAPARILEVGVGLGSTAGLLAERGYQVTAISPDATQCDIARQRVGAGARIEQVTFEALAADPATFDVVLLQESAQYLSSLELFNKSFDLLAPNGEMLLLDEVLLQPRSFGYESIHRLQVLLDQAKRCGFSVEEQLDLSAQALPSVEYLCDAVDAHRDECIQALGLSAARVDELHAALRRYRDHYRAGRFGYALLRLRKATAPRWRVSVAQLSDAPAIRALFEEVFKEPMSQALWEWKYGSGRGMATLAWRDGELVAHYGCAIRDVVYRGAPIQAVQICDVMVPQRERGVLTRQGPFFLAAAAFPELYVGYGARYPIGFGFPNRRAMRVAQRLGLYAEVDRMSRVDWPVAGGRPRMRTRLRSIPRDASANLRDAIDRLGAALHADLPDAIVGRRDWAHVEHRFLNRPGHDYLVLTVVNRIGGRPRGLLVLRRQGEICLLLDVVGALRELPLLIAHAQQVAHRMGAQSLRAWISASHTEYLMVHGGVLSEMDVSVPTSVWTAGPSPEELRGRWWLMAGDTDYL